MSPGQRGTLLAAILGSGMVFLDSTLVNVALPRIGEELRTTLFSTLEAQSYVYNAYLLTLSALLVVGGAWSDQRGRRRAFVLGLVGFGVTSVLCGVAPTMETLIAFRIMQGAAGALLVPVSLALLTAGFEGEDQGRAFGLWAGASALSTIVGPFVGGVLVDTVSWRLAFLINAPLAAVAVWASVRWVAESRDDQATGYVDWWGAVVVALAVGGLTLGAIRGQQQQWQDPVAFTALAVGAAAAVTVPFRMLWARHPLVPPDLFRSRNFTVTNLSTVVIYGGLYVVLYLLVIHMQGTLGYTAAAAGVAQIPSLVFLAVFSARFGALASRYGPRRFMAGGPALMAIAVLWLVRLPSTSDAWSLRLGDVSSLVPPVGYLRDVLPAMTLLGVGLVIMVAPLTTALMRSVEVRHAGVASAVNNALSRVGPQLAGALIFVAVTASFYGALAGRVPRLDVSSPDVRNQLSPLNPPLGEVGPDVAVATREASTRAFHVAMVLAAALFGGGAVINAVGIRDPQRPGEALAATVPGGVPQIPSA
ncbi:MAG TPA: MFS transporter [Nitriliruptorales bacterium]|nr:MFS transporter [Nitriliruptorales bacterium]